MLPKKINAIVWLIKAAELDIINKSCMTNLAGLHFDLIYTLPYAMCLNAISEIFMALEIEDDQNIISTTRFSCGGLGDKNKMATLQRRVADYQGETPICVDTWQEISEDYFSKAVQKATVGMNKTFAELANMPGNSFTLLVVNNDRLPLLELMAASHNKALKVPSDGELVQLRFEGMVAGEDINIKLVYASHHPIELS